MSTNLIMNDKQWIEKQTLFCFECQCLSVQNTNWKYYRKMLSKSVKEDGDTIGTGYSFPICCYYAEGYARYKGKHANYDLYRSFTQIQEYKDCKLSFPKAYHDNILSLILDLQTRHTNTQLIIPKRIKTRWEQYSSFHLKYLVDILNAKDIKVHIGELCLNKQEDDLFVVIFEPISDNKSIEKNDYEIMSTLKEQTPGIFNVSFLSEVSKNGKPLF